MAFVSAEQANIATTRNGSGRASSWAAVSTGALLALGVTLAAVTPAGLLAQHHGSGDSGKTETFLVTGLRIDAESPPPGSAVGRAGARLAEGGYLHVVYGKPYARGRQIFGGLVAYDQIWATGAHQSSELAATVPFSIGGQRLEAGVYSVFTTPGRERWKLHLNSALGMHLADDYDPELDVLVAEAAARRLDEKTADLVLEFVAMDGHGGESDLVLRIRWDDIAVDFPIVIERD